MIKDILLTSDQIQAIFTAFQQTNPTPKSGLQFQSPFELLVAVVLSAQSTDIGVNKVTPKLFAVASTPEQMIELGEDGVREIIRSLGLFNNKAHALIALSKKLLDHYQGQVPNNRADLESLPGVGQKSAGVVLNVGFGQPTIPVDTHVFRVANRTGLAPGKTPEAVEQILLQVVPKSKQNHAHHWLILHGRYICKARKPLCTSCLIRQWCHFVKEQDALRTKKNQRPNPGG
ncbi:MAG: endonuclease III [Magnetococcus sp. DMHC-6]